MTSLQEAHFVRNSHGCSWGSWAVTWAARWFPSCSPTSAPPDPGPPGSSGAAATERTRKHTAPWPLIHHCSIMMVCKSVAACMTYCSSLEDTQMVQWIPHKVAFLFSNACDISNACGWWPVDLKTLCTLVVLVPLSPWRTCPSAVQKPLSLSAAAPWSSAASGTGWFWEAENGSGVRGRR